jgi:two-component system CheB/CheR fusion protein
MSGLRILVVDDCKDTADSLALLLRMWGHDAEVAYDGATALEKAGRGADVVLLDLGMPEMDGCDLARQVRRQADCRDTLVVAITGYADPEHRRISEDAGMDKYLVKPVDFDALREILSRRAEVR